MDEKKDTPAGGIGQPEDIVVTDKDVQDYARNVVIRGRDSAKNKALSRLNGGLMPKKAKAQSLMESDAYRKELEALCSQNQEYVICRDAIEGSRVAVETLRAKLHEKRLRDAKSKQAEEEFEEWKEGFDADAFFEENEDYVFDIIDKEMKEYFLSGEQYVRCEDTGHERWRYGDKKYEPLCAENFDRYLFNREMFDELIDEEFVANVMGDDDFLDGAIANILSDRIPELEKYDDLTDCSDWFFELVCESFIKFDIIEKLSQKYTDDYILTLLKENPLYKDMFSKLREEEERQEQIRAGILSKIPDNYIDFYPQARMMHRRFIIHSGPANSGKSHDAVKALAGAGTGIYLAPLRLLAFEKYEELNAMGVRCSLLTGEESRPMENATHQSSTVEMLDVKKHYELAVIDEAQMLGDRERGGAWTEAILGACAETIHICTSPNALDAIIRLIEACGDEYEVVKHERLVPLRMMDSEVRFPEDIHKGDAVIAFSRRAVLAVAADLQEAGLKCSVIYGALPYDARHSEAEAFNSGERDVIVATDAIGMGLNMDIARVIFLETKKYDGSQNRDLNAEEIAQVAGRAGRYGKYDIGYFGAVEGSGRKLARLARGKIQDVGDVFIPFPERLLALDAPLSDILRKWQDVEAKPGFVIQPVGREIMLADILEKRTEDKVLIYRLVTLNFNEEDRDLVWLWEFLCDHAIKAKRINMGDMIRSCLTGGDDLADLESKYARLDLLYAYTAKFEGEAEAYQVMLKKDDVSHKIVSILKKQGLKAKKCRRCGKRLPWYHQYGICEECYQRNYRRWDDDLWDDDPWDDIP